MKENEEIITKINKLTKGNKSQWIEDAKYREENKEWIKKSQEIELERLKQIRKIST